MSMIQRFFQAIFPKSWAESMEADSRGQEKGAGTV